MSLRIKLYLIAAAIILANIFALKYLYDTNLTLRDENNRLTEDLTLARKQAERLDELLTKKLEFDNKLQRELSRLRGRINQERANDPEFRAWADTPLPAGALRLLDDRDDAAEPAGADGADADP